MPEALAELRASGFLLGVISSKARSRLMDDVASAQLERCFDLLQTGDDVQHAKPHPEGILAAMARLAVDPSATGMVGDTDADICAGRAAGRSTRSPGPSGHWPTPSVHSPESRSSPARRPP